MLVFFDRVLSFLLIFSFSTFLLFPKGGLVIALILILSIIPLFFCRDKSNFLNFWEKLFIFSFILYFFSILLNVLIFSGELRDLDIASRFILVIPIFLYFRKSNISFSSVVWGVSIAALIFGMNIFLEKYFGMNFFVFSKHAGIVSFYGGILGVASLLLINSMKTKLSNLVLLFAGFFGTLTALLAGGRGVWLAAIITLVAANFMNSIKWEAKKRVALILVVSLAIMVSLNAPVGNIQSRVKQTYESVDLYVKGSNEAPLTSVGARIEMWKGAYYIIKDHPLLGVGEDNYKEKKQALIDKKLISEKVAEYNHPHGEYLSSMVEQGIPGFIILIILLSSSFFYSVRLIKDAQTDRQASMGVIAFTISCFYILYSFTNGVFDHQNTTLFYAGFLAIIFGLASNKKDLKH